MTTFETMPEEQSLAMHVPPHSIDAEQSVLGAVLIDGDALFRVGDILTAEDFYRDSHQVLFEAFLALSRKNEPIDTITVAEQLRRRNQLEMVGGASYLIALLDAVPSSANVEYYAGIVRSRARRRTVVDRAQRAIGMARNLDLDDDEVFDAIEAMTLGVRYSCDEEYQAIGQAAMDLYEEATLNAERRTKLLGISSGFPELDEFTDGWQDGEVYTIGARPGMGKTGLMLNLVSYAAMVERRNTAVYSLEMGGRQTTARIISAQASIASKRLRKGWLQDADWQTFADAVEKLQDVPLRLYKTTEVSPKKMRSQARRMKAKPGLDILFIDYLQLLDSDDDRTQNRAVEVAKFSRFVKNLAMELQIPIVILSQLSRAVENRENKRPMLSDLKESGAIEQESSVVIGMYRESYYAPKGSERIDAAEETDPTELLILKNRDGEIGMVKLNFEGKFTRFESMPELNDMGGLGSGVTPI